MSRNKTANDKRINFMSRQDAIKYDQRYYIGGYCKHCKTEFTIRYRNGCCKNCNGKRSKGGK